MKSKQKTRVVVVDDHPMVREMLIHVIAKEPDMVVCGESDNVQHAFQMIDQERPDIAVVDITLKGASGLELIKNLRAAEIEVPVLVLSMHDEALYAERAFRAGAKGYITKTEGTACVIAAIRKILGGELYASSGFASQLLKNLSVTGRAKSGSAFCELSDRELEVFHLIGQGRTTSEIAMSLNLGVKTIDTYRTRLKEKLGLKNGAELQLRAVTWVQELKTRTMDPLPKPLGSSDV